jgi:hypothetical protein
MNWATELTDSILPPVTLQIGKRYIHPEDGLIEITDGKYRDATYGRISNFWHWTVIESGEKKHGYGANWPEESTNT